MYAYAYDKTGKVGGRLGVAGIPHAFLIDPQGKIVWDGHPGELSEATIEKALSGSLPKPLFEFPGSATAVRTALAKHNLAVALAEAAKVPDNESGADLKRAIQGLISGRVANMKSALKDADYLTALEAATALKKDLTGLPEAPEAEKALAEITANKDAPPVIAAQKKIRAILEQKLGKRLDYEKAVSDLKKMVGDLKGKYASKEADEALVTIAKRKAATR
jgi:hypothetical protein